MTDEFGVPVADRLPLSQRQIVEAWNTQQAERQRARAEAEEAFRRDVFQPLWEAAMMQITTARDALPVPFNTDWIAARWAQRLLDTRIAAAATVGTLDETQARRAIDEWMAVSLAAFAAFEAAVAARACKVCGSLVECGHDYPAAGGESEALYPARPSRLKRPE